MKPEPKLEVHVKKIFKNLIQITCITRDAEEWIKKNLYQYGNREVYLPLSNQSVTTYNFTVFPNYDVDEVVNYIKNEYGQE